MISNKIKINDSFSIMIEKPLSDYDRKTLTYLYTPVVSPKGITLFNILHTLILSNEHESLVESIDKLLTLTEYSLDEINHLFSLLEAVGLVRTFYKENIFIFYLQDVLTPTAFFQNELLSQALIASITKEEYDKYALEFLVRRLDITKFDEVTNSFDEIFKFEDDINHLDPMSLSIKTSEGLVIKNQHFDYKHFIIFVSALGIIDQKMYDDEELFKFVNRYSFLYHLTEEEMRDALIPSVVNNQIDYEIFKTFVKRLYNNKNRQTKLVIPQATSPSNDKLINFLDNSTPNDIIMSLYNEPITASEMDMFDRLLADNGISLGFLNVVVLYVVKQKNGEIPSYNYFLKIIKTWKRAGITNASEAYLHLQELNNPKESTTYKTKTKKEVPSWFNDYLREANERLEKKTSMNTSEEIEGLDDFFKSSKKEK